MRRRAFTLVELLTVVAVIGLLVAMLLALFTVKYFVDQIIVGQPDTFIPTRVHTMRQVAALLHCDPDEVVFTAGGTEANNLALYGAARTAPRAARSSPSTT